MIHWIEHAYLPIFKKCVPMEHELMFLDRWVGLGGITIDSDKIKSVYFLDLAERSSCDNKSTLRRNPTQPPLVKTNYKHVGTEMQGNIVESWGLIHQRFVLSIDLLRKVVIHYN